MLSRGRSKGVEGQDAKDLGRVEGNDWNGDAGDEGSGIGEQNRVRGVGRAGALPSQFFAADTDVGSGGDGEGVASVKTVCDAVGQDNRLAGVAFGGPAQRGAAFQGGRSNTGGGCDSRVVPRATRLPVQRPAPMWTRLMGGSPAAEAVTWPRVRGWPQSSTTWRSRGMGQPAGTEYDAPGDRNNGRRRCGTQAALVARVAGWRGSGNNEQQADDACAGEGGKV